MTKEDTWRGGTAKQYYDILFELGFDPACDDVDEYLLEVRQLRKRVERQNAQLVNYLDTVCTIQGALLSGEHERYKLGLEHAEKIN